MLLVFFLAMHYTCHVDLAFASVEHIMRDVNNGWLIRYIHANGASMFFITIYVHMFKNLYYGSYAHPRAALWCSGVVIFLNYCLNSIFRICSSLGSNESYGEQQLLQTLYQQFPLLEYLL